jgi:hypothetical protein
MGEVGVGKKWNEAVKKKKKRGSSAEKWTQFGGERNSNPRRWYIGACYESRKGSDVYQMT